MADEPNKPLDEAQKKVVADWLAKHWTRPKTCPICGNTSWQVGEYVVQPITQQPFGHLKLTGGVSYPGIMVICNTCAYTMYFNAVVMGLFAKKEATSAEQTA